VILTTAFPVVRLLPSATMRRAVCPGSYDPATNGHLDIAERASKLFDEVIVAVMINKKKQGLFTVDERLAMLREVTGDLPNVRVDSWHGLLVDYCKQNEVEVIVKGLRAVSDFDYELQQAQMNHQLTGVETMFMPTSPLWSFLSSSLVKDVAAYSGDVAHLVPAPVQARLKAKFAS
jgi:pantetheine-phosphate adenylyltransferase